MFAKKCNSFSCLSALRAFFQNGRDNSTKRLFEVVNDDLDEVLSQAVDKHEREEAFCNDGLDEILSQSLDMFEEVKNSVEDAIDITDMFEFGGPSLVMVRRFPTKKGEETYIFDHFLFYFLANEGKPLF